MSRLSKSIEAESSSEVAAGLGFGGRGVMCECYWVEASL